MIPSLTVHRFRVCSAAFFRAVLAVSLVAAACSDVHPQDPNDNADPVLAHGRDVWFNSTFGGEKFFRILATGMVGEREVIPPDRRLNIAFEEVVSTPRSERFGVWGTINDPDCTANPEGGPDLCDDRHATGVIGIRTFEGPGGVRLFGATCAACHAGFDPLRPPVDPAEPTWDNIHATIGNQYLKTGKIFGANLPPTDPRRILFDSWPRGTVDTTLLFSDNINNPGVFTAIWEQQARPRFHVTQDGEPLGRQLRNGQGGEDDVGGQRAVVRVYTNIGSCFVECTLPARVAGVPIDVEACRERCPDFPPQADLEALVAFLSSFEAPEFPERPRNRRLYATGRHVFRRHCASCHEMRGQQQHALTDDEISLLLDDPEVTNTCRARTTNWDTNQLWAEFSSDQFKARAAARFKGYRTMPAAGVWATSPYLHNQSVGEWAPPTASPAERALYYWVSMWELLSGEREPVVNRLPVDVGPFPQGTPLNVVFSRDPITGEVLCDDAIENRGHTFGAELHSTKKIALIYWLLFQ